MIGFGSGRPGRALVLAALLSGSAGDLTAQPANQADTLSLADLLALAERHNPELVRARNGVAMAGAARLVARAAFLPDVTASTSFDVSHVRRFTTTDGGRTVAGARAAGARRRAAEADLAAARTGARAGVARAYFGLLERRRMLDVERAILDARRRDVETTERLFPIVAADLIDVLGARIEVRRQEATVAAAEEAARAAGLDLARAVGTEIDPDLPLRPPFEPFDPDSLDEADLVRAALDAHPEILSLAARAEASRIETWDDGWLAYLPVVAARASYVRSEFGGSGRPFLELDPRDTESSFGLWLELPLLDRFGRRAERIRARAAAADGLAALRARRLDAETGVRSRLLGLRSAWRSLQIESETAAMARERAGLARDSYEAGGIDFMRLQQVLGGATEAERALVQRRFDYYRALVELEAAVGRPVDRRER
jgi:outer membrane protein TolC